MRAKEAIDGLQAWTLEAATKRTNRPWCLFGLTKIDVESITALFDRSELVSEYNTRYNEHDPLKKKPHSYLQTEINLVYGMQKAFTARHRSRLQVYRDDAAQKAYHCRRAVTKAFTKFTVTQAAAEAI